LDAVQIKRLLRKLGTVILIAYGLSIFIFFIILLVQLALLNVLYAFGAIGLVTVAGIVAKGVIAFIDWIIIDDGDHHDLGDGL
jgi:hypothetical protein